MPQSPFADYQPQFNWKQATWAAAVAASGYLPDQPVGDLLKLSPYFCTNVQWAKPTSDLQVNMAFVDTGVTMWVGIEGTTNITQAMAFVLRDGLVHPWGDLRGAFRIFHETALSCLIDIKLKINKTKPVVLTGHSLGGAAAAIAADLLKREGYDVRGVITFGQPYFANDTYAASYNVPLDRVLNHLDIVPKFPYTTSGFDTPHALLLPVASGGLFTVPRQLAHAGIPRELDTAGTADDTALFLDRMKQLGTRLTVGQIFSHLMGEYVGLCFEHIGPAGKQLFLPLTQELLKTGSFKLLNSAFPAADPDTLALNFDQIKADEVTFANTLLGPASKVRLRLFKGAFIDPAPGESFLPEEADFPGYQAKIPSANVPISGGGLTACKIGPTTVTYTSSAGPFPPHFIGGLYVTYVGEDNVERNVELKPFPEPIVVSEENQEITVEVEALLSRFSN